MKKEIKQKLAITAATIAFLIAIAFLIIAIKLTFFPA